MDGHFRENKPVNLGNIRHEWRLVKKIAVAKSKRYEKLGFAPFALPCVLCGYSFFSRKGRKRLRKGREEKEKDPLNLDTPFGRSPLGEGLNGEACFLYNAPHVFVFAFRMSTTGHHASPPISFSLCAEVPETFALKQKVNETASTETWEAFDRTKKKKCFLKRFKSPSAAETSAAETGAAEIFEQFKTNIQRWEQLRESIPELPGVAALGQDADGIWLIRDSAEGKSYAELARPDKPMKEHEAARRVFALTNTLLKLHQAGFYHRNLKPANAFSSGMDAGTLVDPDFFSSMASPEPSEPDVRGLAVLLAFCLTGSMLDNAEQVPETFRPLIASGIQKSPPISLADFRAELEQLVKITRPSAFAAEPPLAAAPVQQVPAAVPQDVPPLDAVCPQCRTAVLSIADKVCPQCGRPYFEPCLNCQSLNPFWLRNCRSCNSDLLTLKQHMFANLNSHKQQILKDRESYGHDRTLPLLKYMSTVNHPDFVAFREWAKSMTMLIHKERKDIKAYVEGIRTQANAAMESQKYERVRQILEQVPRPLLDEPLRQQYVDAGEALTEVDSLIREIRNAISTKQYSQLLSCVQRYLELKANDPEAQNLQRKIEKLTTVVAPNEMKLRRLPSGKFYMGSHDSDEYLRNNEHPQHRVSISHSMFIGVYPVTQKQFQDLMGHNPSMVVTHENCPVDSVTWYSALEFCNKMSEAESLPPYYELKAVRRRVNSNLIESAKVTVLGGDGYRLPTEAEWEYACRAGSVSPWCFGDLVLDVGHYAWYYDNALMETHPVGGRKPNSWGLYDMHGNVMEWCYDWYGELFYQQCTEEEENPTGPTDGVTKVLRGGAWQFGAEATRCAYRNNSAPDAVAGVIGFRVCRNASDEAM